jgi:hypothetical protein
MTQAHRQTHSDSVCRMALQRCRFGVIDEGCDELLVFASTAVTLHPARHIDCQRLHSRHGGCHIIRVQSSSHEDRDPPPLHAACYIPVKGLPSSPAGTANLGVQQDLCQGALLHNLGGDSVVTMDTNELTAQATPACVIIGAASTCTTVIAQTSG